MADFKKYSEDVEMWFTAHWGEAMILKPGDYLVKEEGKYYRIDAKEFQRTYEAL